MTEIMTPLTHNSAQGASSSRGQTRASTSDRSDMPPATSGNDASHDNDFAAYHAAQKDAHDSRKSDKADKDFASRAAKSREDADAEHGQSGPTAGIPSTKTTNASATAASEFASGSTNAPPQTTPATDQAAAPTPAGAQIATPQNITAANPQPEITAQLSSTSASGPTTQIPGVQITAGIGAMANASAANSTKTPKVPTQTTAAGLALAAQTAQQMAAQTGTQTTTLPSSAAASTALPDTPPVASPATATQMVAQTGVPAAPPTIAESAIAAATKLVATPDLNVEFAADLGPELSSDSSRETRLTTAGALRADPTAQRPELARSVAQQLAGSLNKVSGRPVEIHLNPTELGRVRLSLSPSDAGLTVNVLAERGETLDLMRRNISMLEQELKELGYEDLNFSFDQNDGTGSDQTDPQNGGQSAQVIDKITLHSPTDSSEIDAPIRIALGASQGLDLRL